MNKKTFIYIAAAALTLLPTLEAAAQNKEEISLMLRKHAKAELKAVPCAERPTGKTVSVMKTAAQKANANTADFYGRKLYGTLINSTEWTDATITDVPYGIYSFDMAAQPAMTSHIKHFGYSFTSGAWGRGKFFGITPMSVMGALNGARYITIDTDTWTETKDIAYDTSKKQYSLLSSVMAYNPIDNKTYSFQYKDDLSGMDWCAYNEQYAEMDKLASFRGKYNVLALAAVPSGEMYFINGYGDLYTVNKANGRPSLVGYTGVSPQLYAQSMMYDGRTGLFLWAAQTPTGSYLYTIDPATADAKQVLKFNNEEQFVALWSLDNEAPDDAPAAAKNLKLAYAADGSLQGTLSFDLPTTTYGGSKLGVSTLNVWLDGVSLQNAEVQQGGKVVVPVELTEGNHYVAVNLKNDGGWSPLASLYQYAGYDVPKAVTEATFSNDTTESKSNVTWAASTGGVNDGYVDMSNLTYTIVRMPDSVTVASDYKETAFSEPTPEAMHNYSYRIYAVNNGKVSDYAETNSLICGGAFTTPYYQSFTDPSTFTDFFTVIDNNGDGTTWRTGYNGDIRFDLPYDGGTADDWVVTPAISLEDNTSYRITINLKTFSKGYPEDFDILVGSDPKDITTFQTVKEARGVELYETFTDYTADFTNATAGRKYVALRYLGKKENNSTMLLVNSFGVTKIGSADAPEAVEDLTVTPGEDDAMAATVSFKTPTKSIKGDDLTALTSVNVYRNDGAEPVYKFNAPAVGSQLSFTDTKVGKVGVNSFTVKAENESGEGRESTATAFIGVYTAPYQETFDTRDASELYTHTITGVDVAANPYYGWKYDETNHRMNHYAFNSSDTDRVEMWLYTPAIRLDADAVYALSYDVNVSVYTQTIQNDVWMGADAKPESQTVKIADMPRSTNYAMKTVQNNVVTTEAGKYRFGFHSLGTAQYDYLSMDLDNIGLTYLKSAMSPYQFTDFTAEADKTGAQSATISCNAPSTDYRGQSLTGYLTVEVYRGQGVTPIYSKQDVAPGAEITYTDTQAQRGFNVYTLVAQNAYGRSEVLTDTVYVGIDTPNPVDSIAVVGVNGNRDAAISWEAPSAGKNGGVIIEDALTYNIYTYDPETNVLTPLKAGVKGNTYTVENAERSKQEVAYYAVSAVSAAGEGLATAMPVTLGKLYELPFKESFANKETATTPWQVDTESTYYYNWGVTNPDGATYNKATAQDNDGGVAYMYNGMYYDIYGGAGFISPKLTLGGADATLKFWVYNIATAYPDNAPTLKVYVHADDGADELVGDYVVGGSTEDGWRQYEVPLSAYKTAQHISLAFYGYTDGHSDVIYLDNITVERGVPSNVAETIGGKAIKSVSSYDLSGRRISSNAKGVLINRTTYTDGTTSTVKTCK